MESFAELGKLHEAYRQLRRVALSHTAVALKTASRGNPARGFESHALRSDQRGWLLTSRSSASVTRVTTDRYRPPVPAVGRLIGHGSGTAVLTRGRSVGGQCHNLPMTPEKPDGYPDQSAKRELAQVIAEGALSAIPVVGGQSQWVSLPGRVVR